jgi:hypothetical protein
MEREGRHVDAIHLLADAVRANPDPEALEVLARLRCDAAGSVRRDGGPPDWPPAAEDRFEPGTVIPEVAAPELDAGVLRSAIVNHGSLLVRGLFPAPRAEDLERMSRTAFAAALSGSRDGDGWYAPVPADPSSGTHQRRGWVRQTGCIWVGDSPRALAEVLEAFEDVHLPELLTGYFGERPMFTLEKSALRRATPEATPEWHQDGAFMGPGLRALNVWVALTACGGDAAVPGIDLLPRRFERFVETGTRGAKLDTFVGPDLVAELAVETPVVRPVFAPGDALFFDDHTLHATGTSPGMEGERYAIEFWFFAGDNVPERYLPMVL